MTSDRVGTRTCLRLLLRRDRILLPTWIAVFVLMALLGLVTALLMGYATSTNRDRSVLHTHFE